MGKKKFRDLTFEEKVVRVKAAPETAVQLLDNQDDLIHTMKIQIMVQERLLKLYQKLVDDMKGGNNEV